MNLSDSAGTTSKSLWRLSGLTVWQLALNAFGGLRRNDAIGRASQLAFDFLFALFPLILLIVTMFGIFTSRSAELRNDFLSYFSNFLPPGAFEVLRTTTDELAMNASGGEFTFGVAAVIWFASGGIASMITALNLAYQMEETRSWFKIRSTAIVLTLVMSASQAAAEVRNTLIGFAAAKQAAPTASTNRKLQEQFLDAELEKFHAGMSTNFAVIQQQTYLAQAETTEVAA